MTDEAPELSDLPYFEESDTIGYIDRPSGAPTLPVAPPAAPPPNVGAIQRVPGGGAPLPQPVPTPGPGTPSAIAPTAPTQPVGQRIGGVAGGVAPAAPGTPAVPAGAAPQQQAPPGLTGPPVSGGAALAAGVPEGGIGPNLSSRIVAEEVALGTGAQGDSGLIGELESGDNPAAMNPINDATHTASGLYQITNENWRNYAPRFGIDTQRFKSAASTMQAGEDQARQMQRQVAGEMYREHGWADWAPFNSALAQAVGYNGPMSPDADLGRGTGGSANPQALAMQMGQQEMELGKRIPGMIASAAAREQEAYTAMQKAAEAADREFTVQKGLYAHWSDQRAQALEREAYQLQSDTEKMDQFARTTPTRQAVYASAMHIMPLLALLTAVGGAATGAHGMVMLGALKGVVDGVNAGAENQFEDAMNRFKNGWDALKEHTNNFKKINETFAEAYGTRADAASKAVDMTREILKDKMTVEQLKIQSSYAGVDAVEKTMANLAKSITALETVAQYAGIGELPQSQVDFYTEMFLVNPTEFNQLFGRSSGKFADPQSVLMRRSVEYNIVKMAKDLNITASEASNITNVNRALVATTQKDTIAMSALTAYLGRFRQQVAIVKQYIPAGTASPFPVLNDAIQLARRMIGDPSLFPAAGDAPVTKLANALVTLRLDHQRVMNTGNVGGTGQLSVKAQTTAETLLAENMTPGMMYGAIEEMEKEINSAYGNNYAEMARLYRQLGHMIPGPFEGFEKLNPFSPESAGAGAAAESRQQSGLQPIGGGAGGGGGWTYSQDKKTATSANGTVYVDDGKGHWVRQQ